MNVCYLEFINFSLGASCMIRQNLQLKNNTMSVALVHRMKTTLRLHLTHSAHRLHTTGFWDEDCSECQPWFRRHVLFISWEKYLAETWVAYLIIHSHVYSVLPEAMHPCISSFCASALNSLCSVLLFPWNRAAPTATMHLNIPCCNHTMYCKKSSQMATYCRAEEGLVFTASH